jgi:hypothetical protein
MRRSYLAYNVAGKTNGTPGIGVKLRANFPNLAGSVSVSSGAALSTRTQLGPKAEEIEADQ